MWPDLWQMSGHWSPCGRITERRPGNRISSTLPRCSRFGGQGGGHWAPSASRKPVANQKELYLASMVLGSSAVGERWVEGFGWGRRAWASRSDVIWPTFIVHKTCVIIGLILLTYQGRSLGSFLNRLGWAWCPCWKRGWIWCQTKEVCHCHCVLLIIKLDLC